VLGEESDEVIVRTAAPLRRDGLAGKIRRLSDAARHDARGVAPTHPAGHDLYDFAAARPRTELRRLSVHGDVGLAADHRLQRLRRGVEHLELGREPLLR
jgi:hypothetical protein